MRRNIRSLRWYLVLGILSAASSATPGAAATVGSRAWSLVVPQESMRGYEYRASCSDLASGRTYLLLASASAKERASLGVATAQVSKDGRLEDVSQVASTEPDEPLVDANWCVVLSDGALTIVGSTQGNSLVAVTERSGRWSSIVLGAGGYEAQIFDAVALQSRLILVGGHKLAGFVQFLDVATGKTKRLEWRGRQEGSLVLDVEREDDGFVICGIEGPRRELISSGTEWFIASFDDQGVERARAYRAGRSCRLLAAAPAAVSAVYVDGTEPIGPLRRVTFNAKLEAATENVVLERAAVGLFLDIAQIGDTFGVLNRSPTTELVEFISQTSGLRLATERLGYFPIGFSDLTAGQDVLLVIGRVMEGEAREPSIRVDALDLR